MDGYPIRYPTQAGGKYKLCLPYRRLPDEIMTYYFRHAVVLGDNRYFDVTQTTPPHPLSSNFTGPCTTQKLL